MTEVNSAAISNPTAQLINDFKLTAKNQGYYILPKMLWIEALILQLKSYIKNRKKLNMFHISCVNMAETSAHISVP